MAGVIVTGAIVVLSGAFAGPGPSPSGTPVTPAAVPPIVSSDAPPPSLTGGPAVTGAPVISGVACDVDEKTAYHVHAHLNIRFEGDLRPIPAGIGQRAGCLYWLHTHAPSGVIHVEAPAETPFTLGQFLDVWGQPLSATRVLSRTIGPGESLFVFVDRRSYEGDPRGIVLGDLVVIELQVGTESLEPLPYTFPAELE